MREALAKPILLAVAAVAGVVTYLLVGTGPPDTGSLRWILLALGVAGTLIPVFDRMQTAGPGTGWRTRAAVHSLGPLGARILLALCGGAFLGGAVAFFLR